MTEHSALIEAARRNPAPLSEWEESFLTDMAERSTATPKQMDTLATIAARRSVAEIAADLSSRLESLVAALCGDRPMERRGVHLRIGTKGSLSIEMEGPKAGTFYDHEADIGGGALRLVEHIRRCSTADAIQWAVDWMGGSSGAKLTHRGSVSPKVRHGDAPSRTLDFARRVWRDAVPAAATPVEAYLASRGLVLPVAPVLRFHPECRRGDEVLPAMVALMSDPMTGEACGVHRTFLRADGSGKAEGNAKMMFGNVGVIRLVPDTE